MWSKEENGEVTENNGVKKVDQALGLKPKCALMLEVRPSSVSERYLDQEMGLQYSRFH